MPGHSFSPSRGTRVEFSIDSHALRGNLLGDPVQRRVAVYLPQGYASSDEEYPVFVDLVGFTGSGLAHFNWRPFGENVPQRLDRLVAEGEMGPVVAVFPDCFTSLGGNQYINSAAMGNWEDYLIDEMLPEIERRFRVRKGREHRAVFGKSSGGYGAIVHGLRHADAWGAVACHSGDMGFAMCYSGDFPKLLDTLAEHDRDIAKLLAHYEAKQKLTHDDMHMLMALAMAASYDPDPAGPKGIRLPVDLYTGELDAERWANWMRHDPVEMVKSPECRENLRSLRGLYIDCGSKDQYSLVYGARTFVKALKEAGIEHRYEEFDDDHTGVDYRQDVSFPYLYQALTP
ncbi:MAG: enterochelin esterase [Actinobacteria bacterium]|nr:enterochelin esterase [Actinomycetota bacterium]